MREEREKMEIGKRKGEKGEKKEEGKRERKKRRGDGGGSACKHMYIRNLTFAYAICFTINNFRPYTFLKSAIIFIYKNLLQHENLFNAPSMCAT